MSGKQTTLDLNGPILSFIQQPVEVSTTLSTATFVGIATATFPTQSPVNLASSTGIISYQWYAEGVGALSNGSFRGATISGTATTTLTLSNLKSPETNNVNFFLIADYTPSAYGLIGVAVTVGSARSTGNAVNDPLSSNIAKLTVLPVITITSQPGVAIVSYGSRTTFDVSATITDSGFGELSYQWNIDGQNLTDNGDTIIGATQPTLFFIPTGSSGISTVKVTVSNPNAISVVSNVVNLNILSPRNIIIFEGFDSQNNYKKIEVNLDTNDVFLLTDDTFGSTYNTITFYAAEKNIDADLEIRTSKGLDVGSYSGGQGGFSRIRITLEKNIEHTVLGISNNSGLFIYRKSSLIAVSGKGGNAGSIGNGGRGGGINVAGEPGSGRNSGSGGALVSAGTLPSNGIFGSLSALIPISPDTKATGQTGGRIIPCSKGNYWLSRGKSPCEDIGLTQFYNTNGSLISQSSLIVRGFKPGYTITSTEGAATSNGGNGGGGATGGNGGNEGGGGGGSGYSNNSYTTLSTSSGGNTSSKSTINFKIYFAPLPVRGCTDPGAENYNPVAQINDGSCRYSPPPPQLVFGCTNPAASNYNPAADIDNGSCIFPVLGCTNPAALNYNPAANVDNGSCIPSVLGCTNPAASNYNPAANVDNGTCILPVPGCTNPAATNYNPAATVNNGTCILPSVVNGCTNSSALNYNPSATVDNGTCILPVLGCTNSNATNYNPAANVDNGTCIFPVLGCTNPAALNYNPSATVDNGTCIFPIPGCTNPAATNYNPSATVDNGSCILPSVVNGCTNPAALNYNPSATVDNGSCILPVLGCTNPIASNYNPAANIDNGSCILPVPGCTNSNATNYNPAANVDNGSCIFPIPGCTNPGAENYNPSATVDNGSCSYPPTPTPSPLTAQSIYGTGLQGSIEYNNGVVSPASNGSNAFINSLKPEFVGSEINALGTNNITVANYITSVYQDALGRPPDGPGFDYWFAGAINGDYGSLAELENSIKFAYSIDEGAIRQENGGLVGTFDSLGNRI